MAFNRLVDAAWDARNPRTADRPLPRGQLSRGFALCFVAASSLLFFFAAAQLNPLALALPPAASAVALGYSYTERFTWASHLVLGAALGLAPVGGWIVARGDLEATPLLLGLAVLFWVAGFDILYALQDEDFDRQVGLYSLPGRLGRGRAMAWAKYLHSGAGLGFFLVGRLADLGWLYFVAVISVGLLLWWQHRLLSPQDLSGLNHSFFTLKGSVSLILGAATLFSVWP